VQVIKLNFLDLIFHVFGIVFLTWANVRNEGQIGETLQRKVIDYFSGFGRKGVLKTKKESEILIE
jgi:hypothetical protein